MHGFLELIQEIRVHGLTGQVPWRASHSVSVCPNPVDFMVHTEPGLAHIRNHRKHEVQKVIRHLFMQNSGICGRLRRLLSFPPPSATPLSPGFGFNAGFLATATPPTSPPP